MTDAPPGYAWDWFSRQRLLWREARARLAASDASAAARYRDEAVRGEVTAALREDYARDHVVRHVVDDVVRELAFLGRTDASFDRLGASTAPRGMRWWWTYLTGEEVAAPPPRSSRAAIPETQLRLDEVLTGYGDDRGPRAPTSRRPEAGER